MRVYLVFFVWQDVEITLVGVFRTQAGALHCVQNNISDIRLPSQRFRIESIEIGD